MTAEVWDEANRNVLHRARGTGLLQGGAWASLLLWQRKIIPPCFWPSALVSRKETLPTGALVPSCFRRRQRPQPKNHCLCCILCLCFWYLDRLRQESCQGWEGPPDSQSTCQDPRSARGSTRQHGVPAQQGECQLCKYLHLSHLPQRSWHSYAMRQATVGLVLSSHS